MIDQLEAAFNYHQQALGLRQQRHKVLASNIANADTPNYKARDFDFASELKKAVEQGRTSSGGLSLARTSERHLAGQGMSAPRQELLYRIPDQPSLDPGSRWRKSHTRTRPPSSTSYTAPGP